jgi:DNA replication protein DnaC
LAPGRRRARPVDRLAEEHMVMAPLPSPKTDSRDGHGGQLRIETARFPARKTLEEFDFAFQIRVANYAFA